MLRSPRILFLALLIFGALTLFWTRPYNRIPSINRTTSTDSATSEQPTLALPRGRAPAGSSTDAKNDTLGFERVFVINLPERYDKLDAFSLAASLTGFKHDVIEGIKGATIVNKTLPSLENLPPLIQRTDRKSEEQHRRLLARPFKLCAEVSWSNATFPMAHLTQKNRIVRDRISTALVLEDDSDWDVSFKEQLVDFATGARYVQGLTTKPRSPYGDDWDLLWLGHCSAQQNLDNDQRRFVVENDPTVPPMNHRVNFNEVPKLVQMGYDNTTRIVFEARDGVCLYSYALSYRGAQKVLRWQNNVKRFNPIDIGIGNQCKNDPNFKCIAVFPQLVDSHKSAGRQSRDSDIGQFDPKQIREKGFTYNIVRSTRLNIENLMNHGQDAKIEDQWTDLPELTGPPRRKYE
ncbi:MAG: hypothetical protein LQ350_007387 [Teloschistes chrysophthalmus]|nr:MAG: hypothetical protein LQ350_007387 [Niorma chrysophthalma]